MCVIVFDVIGVHNHDFLTINATNLCLMDQFFDDQFRIYTDINQKQNLVGVFRIKKKNEILDKSYKYGIYYL